MIGSVLRGFFHSPASSGVDAEYCEQTIPGSSEADEKTDKEEEKDGSEDTDDDSCDGSSA